ncbi:plant virulence effector HPE1-like domain-containing protein [Agrobacterium tumefaciens]|uniref:plant virulence effector HPE1-like domain-containing protein n=1 Tax=Agrobacterium tumefaciens TaxID=358 RepID=UPI00287EE41F|nr:plant virulence effector HPE1-like domain-containing protein [Agrobacterium tumefaciens]MDS7596321.1 plant virulence effector HPE1-like domain-containing protein [Agrobacterium tumefaciens]
MRRAFVTAIIALTSGSAMASSIEYVYGTKANNGSFTPLECVSCPPLKEKPKADGYSIPSIAPGTQQSEMREIDGRREIVRTEAWLGGAPVTFISKTPTWLPLDEAGTAIASDGEKTPTTPAAEAVSTVETGVDTSATTAAIKGDAASGVSASTAPDFSDFKLRTD